MGFALAYAGKKKRGEAKGRIRRKIAGAHSPWTRSVADATLPLLIQLVRDVAKPATALDARDTRLLVELDGVHPVKLKDEMAVLAAEAKVGVAVAAALGRDLDAGLGAAADGVLDVLLSEGHRDGDGLVGGADVEGSRVHGVVLGADLADGYLFLGEAVGEDGAPVEGLGEGDAGAERQAGCCELKHGGSKL